MKSTRITPDITYVEPTKAGSYQACAGVIVKGEKTLCIDLNLGPATPALLEQSAPHAAVITHYHLDHSIWTRFAASCCDAQVFVPEKEREYLSSLEFVLEKTAGRFDVKDQWRDFMVQKLGFTPLKKFECYTGSTGFNDFFPGLACISTPGHSPGHSSFYFSNEKLLFSGDMGLDPFGPWYGWPDCRLEDIVTSILDLMQLDVRMILTSHGGIITEKIKKAWIRALSHLVSRENEIRSRLAAGMDRETIVKNGIFFVHKNRVKQPLRSFMTMWDTVMFNHHHLLLQKGGLVHRFPVLESLVYEDG